MAGLITYNGAILLANGGLAASKDCCCVSYNCYCFTHSVNYAVVARWKKCYRSPIYDTATGQFIFKDGQPCDGSVNGIICPPGTVGRFVTYDGIVVRVCGCGSSGEGYNASILKTPDEFNTCTDLGSPP